jgi:hypothetical protein
VQTLTIPLLAGGADRDRPVLSAFRRDRGGRKNNRTEPEGCDPAVFAEQITEYLREAQERRDAPAPPPRPAPAPAGDAVQGSRLATVKNGKSERLARLLAAAVEETPEDFREFLLPPTPARAFAPTAEESDNSQFLVDIERDVAPDIKLSRSSTRFTSDDIPTYEFDITADDGVPVRDDVTPERRRARNSSRSRFATTTAACRFAPPATSPPRSLRPGREDARIEPSPSRTSGASSIRISAAFPALIAKLDEIAARESDT